MAGVVILSVLGLGFGAVLTMLEKRSLLGVEATSDHRSGPPAPGRTRRQPSPSS